MMKCVKVDEDTVLNDDFFYGFFPCVKGHAKLTYDCYSSQKNLRYSTVRNDQITFYDPDEDDPDYRVKIVCTKMIVAISEVEQGVENLWKRGRSNVR